MKRRLHYIIVCAVLILALQFPTLNTTKAQVVPDSYRKQKQVEMLQFTDSIHDEFVRYLEHLWTEYQLFEGELFPLDNKPVTQPHIDTSYRNEDTLKTDRLMQYEEIGTMQEVEEPVIAHPSAIGNTQMRDYSIPFYGRRLSVAFPAKVAGITLSGIGERQVAHYWKRLLESHVDRCVASLDRQRRDLFLNDWGFFDLIRHFSATVYPNRANEQAVLSVFLLDALHYDARVGRLDDCLVMLINTGSLLYETNYVEIDGARYYVFGDMQRKGRLYTYDRQMSRADRQIDMHLSHSPRLGGALSAKSFSSSLAGHTIAVRVNQPLMDFYANYPPTELSIYATAALEEAFAASIEREFRPLVKGKKASDALNTLLLFMQQAFKYQTDTKQFGREKNFFCEENFYYPANDCEDRAILFARIVQVLFGYDAALLEYDDHVAAAVHVPDGKVGGYYFDIHGKRYTVCDPTCIGAVVGDLSQKYRNKKANVIELKSEN